MFHLQVRLPPARADVVAFHDEVPPERSLDAQEPVVQVHRLDGGVDDRHVAGPVRQAAVRVESGGEPRRPRDSRRARSCSFRGRTRGFCTPKIVAVSVAKPGDSGARSPRSGWTCARRTGPGRRAPTSSPRCVGIPGEAHARARTCACRRSTGRPRGSTCAGPCARSRGRSARSPVVGRELDVGHVVGGVVDVQEPLVAQTQVEREVRLHLPVVLHERRHRLRAVERGGCAVRSAGAPDRSRSGSWTVADRPRSRTRC